MHYCKNADTHALNYATQHHYLLHTKKNTIKSLGLSECQVDAEFFALAFENEHKNNMENYSKIQLRQSELERLFVKESNFGSTANSDFFASLRTKDDKSFF